MDNENNFLKSGGAIQSFYSGNNKHLPIIDAGIGVYLYDTDGKKYLDASSGPVTCNIGHGNRHVLEAMQKQANKVCFASYNFFENAPNRHLAKNLISATQLKFDQAFIVSGGSEAIEASLKLARQYAVYKGRPGKWKILARNPSYHGSTLGAFGASGDPEAETIFGPIAQIFPKVPTPFSYRIPANHDNKSFSRYCAALLEKTILEEGPNKVLAFVVECVGGLSTGALVSTPEYYSLIREICNKYDVLLIFDEVMSGVGRTGTFLAAEHWPNCVPDLVVLAKGLSAGYSPLGAVLVPNWLLEPIVKNGGFMHGHTYASNPLSCAVANAVLEEVKKQDIISNVKNIGPYLSEGLAEIARNSKIIGDVRGLGLLLAIEIVKNKTTKKMFGPDMRAVYRLAEIGLENGILLYTRKTSGGQFGEWMMITPPLNISKKEVDHLLCLLGKTIKQFEKEIDII